MKNNSLLDKVIWWVLLELQKEEYATKDGYLVKFIYSTNPAFSREDERRSLKWLENRNALEIKNNFTNSLGEMPAVMLGTKPGIGVTVKILRPEFDNIFKKYEKLYKEIKLNGSNITFNEDSSEILVDKTPCPIPPHKNEYYLCKVMINNYKVRKFIDWSEIYEEMMGAEVDNEKRNKRMVNDAMYAVNNRLKEVLGVEKDLFTWKIKAIKRNY